MTRRFVLLLPFLLAFSVRGAEPKITKLIATESGGKVSVSFELAGVFDLSELNKALESGLPTGFTYYVELVRHRPNWFDSTIGDTTLEVICSYDSRTREYLLNFRRNDRLVRTESFNDLEKLRQRMSTIDERDLLDVKGYRPYKLRVRVRADVMRGYLLYMIPWDVSTEWRETKVKSVK